MNFQHNLEGNPLLVLQPENGKLKSVKCNFKLHLLSLRTSSNKSFFIFGSTGTATLFVNSVVPDSAGGVYQVLASLSVIPVYTGHPPPQLTATTAVNTCGSQGGDTHTQGLVYQTAIALPSLEPPKKMRQRKKRRNRARNPDSFTEKYRRLMIVMGRIKEDREEVAQEQAASADQNSTRSERGPEGRGEENDSKAVSEYVNRGESSDDPKQHAAQVEEERVRESHRRHRRGRKSIVNSRARSNRRGKRSEDSQLFFRTKTFDLKQGVVSSPEAGVVRPAKEEHHQVFNHDTDCGTLKFDAELDDILSTPVEGEAEEEARLLSLCQRLSEVPTYPDLYEVLYGGPQAIAPSPSQPGQQSELSQEPMSDLTLSDFAYLTNMFLSQTPQSLPQALHPLQLPHSGPVEVDSLDGSTTSNHCDWVSKDYLCDDLLTNTLGHVDNHHAASQEPQRTGLSDLREEMRRQSQWQREQGARVTSMGVDNNILIVREQYSLEGYLDSFV